MNEEDLSIEGFRSGLEEHQSKIGKLVIKWRNKTRSCLVGLLREEDMEYAELLQPPKNMDPSAFARLSDDHKLLLRADSLFYVDQANARVTRSPPYAYDRVLRAAYLRYVEYPIEPWEFEYEAEVPDLDIIHRHAGAQEMTRELLADLGKPNASFLEMDQLYYTCESCHDQTPREWTSMIGHYLEQKRINAKIEKNASALAQEGIIYDNVHEPNDKPMIKLSQPKSPVQVPARECSLCAKKPIALSVVVSEAKLDKHLLEVHGVTEPKSGIHYQVPRNLGYPSGMGYDYEDGDTEIEEVEVDNELEKEAQMGYVYNEEGSSDEDDGNEGSVDSAQLGFVW
ncbi:hypothetical protein FRC11_006683 [Ceratobasidium sp. 423]|nr:hypothetical protein FRC11_006683 [Ceratobasidium sp. 423]